MSDSDDDNIFRYGTQLEPYEEDRTSALPKTNTKLTNSRKKKLRKLLAANVNVNKACEVCHLSWPEICQLIPGIDHLSEANSSMGGRKRRKRNRPKVRVRSVEHLSRENEHNKIQFWGDNGVNTQTSHDCGKSPHNWEINMQSSALFESDINQESLEQPYRPPQTYTQEVLHTTHPNNGEEPGSAHDTAYETNRRKRSSSVGKPNWEPVYKVKKSSQVGFEEPNYWTRDRSPPRSRHDMALMDFRSNNSYERTQLKYNDTDTFQVKVHDGMRAVNRHCSDSSDVNPFSDHRHNAQKTSSEGGASHKDWLEPDRPSRSGLRNETHPPARAHTYTDFDDKKLKDSKYKKNSWESSVKYLDRETDRPLRNELRVETQTTATICINDDSDEEYRGRTYKPRTRVDEGRGHFELREPNRRETEYGEECHSRWDQRTENQTTFEDNVTNVEGAGPIRVAIRNVTAMTEKQMTAVLRDINHAIVRIGVQGAGPKFSGSTYKTGWILMNCENHMSRTWLEKEVPSLKPWPEAKLSVTPPDDFSKPKQVSIFIPHKEGVKVSTALELLRVQNPELDTKNWEVLTVMKTISSQIVFLSVDNASFEALRRLNFKANLGTNKIDFWVEPEPIVRCDLVSPPPQDVPLASSSTYTERESNSISRIGENTTTKVSRKVRRMLRRTHVVHGQPSANAKPSLLGHPFLMPSGPSLPQVNPSVSSSERGLALPQALPSQPGASYTPKKRWYPISDQSNPSSIGLRGNITNW